MTIPWESIIPALTTILLGLIACKQHMTHQSLKKQLQNKEKWSGGTT